MKIKQQMLDIPRASNKRVSDQFPRAIQERRKILIPYLVKARSDGKRASLVHDKLHIDDATFTVDKLPPGPAPELPPRRSDTQHQNARRQTNNSAPRGPQVPS
ncbi:hypothetical protein DPMN_016870 [Dreissena polymorpha]|uniref:Uncharacterized protein n=1 Tax=Dreissena polymorpha TaxID=45954 RepID=A0A9D4S7K4_DREPO|nr:hypothetical protein DPMN_016870 [Dreissena polymorpha]